MERRRFELSALEVFEVGKPWTEADGGHSRGNRLLPFLRQEMRRIGRPRLTQQVARRGKLLSLLPRGVAFVVALVEFSPRNPRGMTTAGACYWQHRDHEAGRAIAVCARCWMEILRGSWCAARRAELSPRQGSGDGRNLVDHKDVDLIAFTGSREVGLRIGKRRNHTAWSKGTQARHL